MEPKDDPVALAAKLPLTERVIHKIWKVREAAYRELADKFNVAEENAKIYSDFLPILGKIVRDANAPAQLVGYDALAKYADTAPPQLVRRVATDISKGIAGKGLTGRPTNKGKAVEVFLTFVGADAGDLAVEAMTVTGFKHRTPKVVAAAVDAITLAVTTYGTGAVPVKVITSNLPPLFIHSQETVRNAAKALIIELHRWVGDAVKTVVKDAKEVTIKEVEAAFAKHANQEKAQPQKLTRSLEQRVRERGGAGFESDGDDGFGGGMQEAEELDLSEEINLIEKLSKVKIEIEDDKNRIVKNFYSAVDSKKWSARKEALDAAISIIGEARIIPANFQDIFSRLRKVLSKDSNVNVVASAAKLIQAMCAGLKKNFASGPAKALTADLFFRLKEKNRIVVSAVTAALDAMHSKKCIRIYEMLEEVSTAAKHKVPKARFELLSWLSRSIREGTSGVDLKGSPLKCFGLLFLKGTDDSSPEVRDAAAEGLASLQKVVGERNVAAYLEKLDKKRKDKVAAIVEKLLSAKPVASSKATESKSQKRAAVKTSAKPRRASGESKAQKKSGLSPKRKKTSKPPEPKPYVSDDEGEISRTCDEALALAEERFEGFEKEQWSGKSFKARAAAVGLVVSGLEAKGSLTEDDVSLALGLLSSPPGLGDSNFMAVKPKLELFGMLASNCSSPLPRKTLKPLLRTASEKFGDIKCSKIIGGIMMTFAEATSPRFLFSILGEAVQETNNNRAVIAILKFAGTLVEDFGLPAVPGKSVASVAVPTMGNKAPAAQKAAVALACKASMREKEGEFRKSLVELNAGDEILELFDAEIQKYGREPDPPSRKKRFGESITEPELVEEVTARNAGKAQSFQNPEEVKPETEPGEDKPDTEPEVVHIQPEKEIELKKSAEVKTDLEQLIQPAVRVSIAHAFAPGLRLFLDLKNSNWKKRQEALAVVTKAIEDGGNFIQPDIGNEIVVALRARLSDSNRNIAAAAYDVVGRLALAMGSGGLVYLKPLGSAVFSQGCVDIKKTVREAAMRVLMNWYDMYGLLPLLPFCHLPLGSLNSSFRKEFLEWLVPRLQGVIGSFDSSREDLSALLDSNLACLRDRTAEVRHLADLMLEQVIRSVGVAAVEGKLLAMPKGARHQLEPVLDKYRGAKDDVAGGAGSLVVKSSGISTPRGIRERPRSMAVARTPVRKASLMGQDPITPAASGPRRPRPASARMSPMGPLLTSLNRSASESADDAPLLTANDGRASRERRFLNKRREFIGELTRKGPSGSAHPMISEDMEDLSVDLRECCSSTLCTKMAAPANRFRMHVEAIESVNTHLESNPETLRYASDVLIRWAAFRIEDSKTPPTVLVKLASFVSNICEILMASGAKLGEYETCAILPAVVRKCGSNRESLRKCMRNALQSIGDVVDDDIFLVLLTTCLKYPVDPRAHDEVSNEICRLIDKRCVSGAGMPAGVLTTIGKVAGGEDDGAGRAAALCLERAHEFFGDDLWNLVGDLTDNEAAYLDDRLNGVVGGRRNSSKHIDAYAQPAIAASAPNDIRNEDFRLSIAPAPPSHVMSSISDSLNMATPRKTREQVHHESVLETPSLPAKARKAVQSNDENEEMWEDILGKLRSEPRDTQLSGLARIFEDLQNSGVLLKCNGSTKVLLQLSKCFRQTLTRLEQGTAEEGDPAVMKSFLRGVIRFAREPDVVRRLDQNSVEVLLTDALDAMIPQTVSGVADWDVVRRGVNLMIVKVLESCDQNLLYTAMINLLLENIRTMQQSNSARNMDCLAKSSICIKSIAKVTKRGFTDCRVNALLRDIHLFLMANPVRRDGATSAEDQTFAMRLLKTVVNAIVDEMGGDIRLHLDLIPQQDRSQLVHYINMTLSDRVRAGESPRAGSRRDSHGRRSAESSVSECLSRIEAGNNSEAALRELHSILIGCPDFDLNAQLEGCSSRVGSFVRQGLRSLGHIGPGMKSPSGTQGSGSESHESMEEVWGADMSPRKQSRSGGTGIYESVSGSSSSVHSAGQVYLKRLQEIQLRYGLQTGARGVNHSGASTGVIEKENGAVDRQPSGEEARGKASTLRERMARIRELQSLPREQQ